MDEQVSLGVDGQFRLNPNAKSAIPSFLARQGALPEHHLLLEFALERVRVDPATGKVTFNEANINELASFFERRIKTDPETVEIEGSAASLLWSWNLGDPRSSTQDISYDLYERSGHKIRIIGATSAGRLLNELLDAGADANHLLMEAGEIGRASC